MCLKDINTSLIGETECLKSTKTPLLIPIVSKPIAGICRFILRPFNAPNSKKKTILFLFIYMCIACLSAFSTLYTCHRGFRRTCQFWSGIAPLVLEKKLLDYRCEFVDKCDIVVKEGRMNHYRRRTAPKIVDLILSLGGIYIKIGQLFSTIGTGILDEEYVKALRPLQDGVPARDFAQISKIIEQSTGEKMSDIFSSFEEVPIGAASIAQAHRAVLRKRNNEEIDVDDEVIVKIQYPEVAELFRLDFNNLELVTKLMAPDNLEFIKSLRKRHENELDFRIEADNLRECTSNLQKYDIEPRLVRIPRVRNETGICTKHVLAMEYLRGTGLSKVIEEEQHRFAKALGHSSAEELRKTLGNKMRKHFEESEDDGTEDRDSNFLESGKSKASTFIMGSAPFFTNILRAFLNVKLGVDETCDRMRYSGANVLKTVSAGKINLNINRNRPKKHAKNKSNFDLSRVLKTLIHVHGIQMIKDGVYNADPHPGNVLVLPDGRLGLLDYGMVGRLVDADRKNIAKLIIALSNKDKNRVAQIYKEGGYKAIWMKKNRPLLGSSEMVDDNLLHRFATWHFDRLDLSPVILANTKEKKDIMVIMKSGSVREIVIPDWIDQGRRLTGLLMGVSAQAARPVSISKQWKHIAEEVISEKSDL